ncbi:MAG: uracil-DNA glycosylase family protein [bacterium]|nr:uracil-DNA glycosylase family protein [bacterium]
MQSLLKEIKSCKVCKEFLEHGVNPVFSFSPDCKIAIIGQAPGRIVHETSIPWNDKSGENLRSWMGIDADTFYDDEFLAIIPMGFCYPGKGKSGDLPPRKECAPLWHEKIFEQMRDLELIILIGQYAQEKYLESSRKESLTKTIQNFEEYLPKYFVLPHPSPRNNIWQAKNPWFKDKVLPTLKSKVQSLLP